MSYSSDPHFSSSSSYRKVFGAGPRFNASGSSSRMKPRTSSSLPVSRSLAVGSYARSVRSAVTMAPGDSVDVSQASVLNSEMKIIRTNEKEQLQGLNDRFVSFIEKVRTLEQQNKALETELTTMRQRHSEPRRLAELYQRQISELRAQLAAASGDRDRTLIERDTAEDELRKLQSKFEEESRARDEAEQALRCFRKDVDDATVARLQLERRVEALLDEMDFMRKVHDEEVAELTAMMHAAQVSVDVVDTSKPDLTSALKEIRCQFESLASKNMQSTEEWYKAKFYSLNEQTTRNNEALRAAKEELNEHRRQVQSKSMEIEALRGTSESLERQMREMEDEHSAEVAGYQETISHLELELRNTKSEMAHHLRDYQDLLNTKMALDIEIAAYRKLLEGEETHFGAGTAYSSINHDIPSMHHSYQSHSFTSSTRNPKKEKDDEQGKPKSGAQHEEMTEENLKKKEMDEDVDVNSN